MKNVFKSEMKIFVNDGELPVYVVYRAPGTHPAKLFHSHDYSEIAIIISGDAEHIADDQREKVSAGDILLIHPGTVHAYDRTGNMEIVNLLYDHSRLSLPILDSYDMPLLRQILPPVGEYRNSAKALLKLTAEELTSALEAIQELDDELKNRKPGRQFHTLAMFMKILSQLARIGSFQDTKQRSCFQIGDAISYINRHFQKAVNVEKLAKTANMSLRNFQRYFKNTTGCSPAGFLTRVRLRNAANLLINSDEAIGIIALNCGFYDSNYFCKKFKEHFGVSPKQFRLQHR